MNKLAIVLLLAIAVIAIFAVWQLLQPPFTQTEETANDENVGPGALDVLSPEELAEHELIVQQSDPVRYQALKEKNIGLCDTEPKASDIEWCKAALAEALKDASVCPKLSNSFAADQCYNDVARATANSELCRSIAQSDVKDECLAKTAVLNNDVSLCYQLENIDTGDNCIAEIAMDQNDTSICSKVRDAEFREDCITNITG